MTSSAEDFRAHPLMPFLDRGATAILENAQPYNGDHWIPDHPLMRLTRLWNTDKHRVLNAAFAQFDLSSLSYEPRVLLVDPLPRVEVTSAFDFDAPVVDGTPLHHIAFAPIPDGLRMQDVGKVEVKGEASQIAFDPDRPGHILNVDQFRVICATVAGVIASTRPLFD